MSDEYECVDREHGLWKKRKEPKDPNVNADRLALALSLETIQGLERENAALWEDKKRLDCLEQTLLSLQLLQTPQMDGTCFVGSLRNIGAGGSAYIRIRGSTIRAAIDAALAGKEAQP